MAFLKCTFNSASLGKSENFNAIIPEGFEENSKALYLLHGLSDCCEAWCRYTSIERYAEERGIVVIMPDAARSFYADSVHGENYYTYISKELPEYTRKLFKLSSKKEDTFIAGLSMGGYGALKIALRNSEYFGGAASLSGVLDIVARDEDKTWETDFKRIFGDTHDLSESCEDVMYLAKNLRGTKPRIYQACGTEDFLYEDNIRFRSLIENLGFDYKYDEGPGSHDWAFWDAYICRAIDFLIN